MKITYKILLINFVIVFLVLGTAASAFYSIMYNILTAQQSKFLLESTNDFIYAYRENLSSLEEDFLYLSKAGLDKSMSFPVLQDKNLDYILKTDPNTGNIISSSVKNFVFIKDKDLPIKVFFSDNPFNITSVYKDHDGFVYYYGKIINKDFINNLSKRIKSDIAIIWQNSPSEISNENQNEKFSYSLNQAYSDLSHRNNFDVYSKNSDETDLLATIYKPNNGFDIEGNDLQFLIFTTVNAAADLRSSIRDIVVVIGFAGVLISLILTFIFTDKMRKQITDLSKGTEITKGGNLQNRITVKSKDELGKLAEAFNMMLGELEKNQRSKNEYSEFITLLNQNPSLNEVSEASLKKIILTCGFTIGALYTVEDEEIQLASYYGVKRDSEIINKDLLLSVIKSKEALELTFQNSTVITTGIHSIRLNYLLILPIIYNSKVIALLELSGAEAPSAVAREYIHNIQEQLAIGLTNAIAFVQLEKVVAELKQLNEEYQKQNIQIRKQNETLIDLHSKLKEKAEELEIQRRKAEESTKLKSQFLASMSHELRTPMNSILGLSELLLDEPVINGKNKERLEVVLKSGKRLMILINDILDLSKIEAGKMEIREENVLLEEMIRDVEYSISPLLISNKVDFRIKKISNTKIIINTDRGKVTQVLVNLLGNAVKFTEEGFVELKIYTKESNTISFDVLDTGIGISEEDQKIIFNEFRQADGTTTRKYGGTGLGLAICKRIADLLNGNLTVQSTLGKGSIFTFSIPLTIISEQKEEEKQKEEQKETPAPVQNRKKPVLIIDKDAEVRFRLSEYLNSRGYEIIDAEDGKTGIQKAISNQPFAIALDILLPDSWEVLKSLKNNEKTKDIPVVLFSIDENKNAGYGLGAFEYIIKPFSYDQLSSSLSRLENIARKRIEKITIVDDDEYEFEKFKNEFKNENIRIDYIQNSELAYARILETQPDLVIIDLIMPKIDGITLSYKIKSSKETKHIPVIISTAKDITDEEKKSLKDVVENITVKSKGHPLDVLKIVRDRIRMQEITLAPDTTTLFIENPDIEIVTNEEKKPHIGEVLVIDDDQDTLFTINEILSSINCKTYLAKGGFEGMKLLENIHPDIILLDIMMPVMDGFQTIKQIKVNPRLSTIPVYAVTAKAMLDDKDIIIRNGFTDYIPKPINAGILSNKIKKAFSNLNLK